MAGWLCDKNLNLNKRATMKYTLEQCIEQQKKVDASIKHNGEYMPWLAGVKEVIEMCDHLSLIDTWKKQPFPDNKQAFMETVDVFAFIMSNAIYYKEESQLLRKLNFDFSECDTPEVILRSLINDIASDKHGEALWILVWFCGKYFLRDEEDLFYYYMGKQTLTQFRQANGYKTGDYVKNWAGKEDNEHLTDMLENGVTIEYLPEALEHAYNLAVKHA